jgi:hypothetical protein
MSLTDALAHLLHLVLPAWALAALLAPALVRWQIGGKRRPRALWMSLLLGWALLALLGSIVMVAGLWWTGRDGRTITYALLVLVLGSVVAAWRSR